jgi:hypothetical protein
VKKISSEKKTDKRKMSKFKQLKTLVIIFEYLLVIVHGAPVVDDDDSIDTKYIDINNISDTVMKHLTDNKINVTELRIQQQLMKANPNNINAGAPAPFTQRSNEEQSHNESAYRRE